uniref:Uncharacterized protein n=1 Tax=Timema monikensis TaxID=170555 RepID=A0A7R9E3M6_9NEOP|nr:unnamed protein product [Timema monikensis]
MPRDGRLATGDVGLGRERSASSRDVRNASEDFNGRRRHPNPLILQENRSLLLDPVQRCRQFCEEAMKIQLLLGLAMALQTSPLDARNLVKRTFSDQTILGYLTEVTDVLVERDLQGGVPDAVPLQVPLVVLLPQPRALLQRLLHDDGHRIHLDSARPQLGDIAEGLQGLTGPWISPDTTRSPRGTIQPHSITNSLHSKKQKHSGI